MDTFAEFARRLIEDNLQVIVNIIVIVARFVGIGFVIAGMTRLYRASEQTMMHRVSPMGTLLYFVVGTIFVAYTPYLSAFSNSLFGTDGNAGASISNQYIMNQGGDCATIDTGGYRDANPFCPMMKYASEIPVVQGSGVEDYTAIMSTITYAVLFVIGLIAFLRGLALLIKVGDGGQGGTLPKAITHIIAGLVAVNAPAVYGLMDGIYSGLVPTS